MWRSWRVCLLLGLLVAGQSSAIDMVLYTKIFDGQGVTPSGTYESYTISLLRCAALCVQHTTCIVWSWDSANFLCLVYSAITPTSWPNDATPTTTVFAEGAEGYFFTNAVEGVSAITWNDGKALCEAENGVLGYVPNAQLMNVLMQTVRRWNAYTGIQRATSTSLWLDLFGNVPPTVYWAPGEPSTADLVTYFQFTENGILVIWPTHQWDKAALCVKV